MEFSGPAKHCMTVAGSADPLSAVLSLQSAATRQTTGIAVQRQILQQEKQVAELLGEVAASAAPGAGRQVDRRV